MYVVFVTGGLASGKKTVCSLLQQYGATVFDLDAIAKKEQESPCVLASLQQEFGKDVLTRSGELDRSLLAKRAFATVEAADKLNAICWPPVLKHLTELLADVTCEATDQNTTQINRLTDQQPADNKLIAVEIPLLVEASLNAPEFLGLADEIIAVETDIKVRFARAVKRGMKPTDAQNRLRLQASDEQRRALATVVFNNNGTYAELEKQVRSWYAHFFGKRVPSHK